MFSNSLFNLSEKVIISRYFSFHFMNTADLPKKIVKYPEDKELKAIILKISNSQEYIDAPYFRNQLQILKDGVKEFGKRLTQQQLGDLFRKTQSTINHQLVKAKKEKKGEIFSNGRPFILTDSEVAELRDFATSSIQPPKICEVKAFIEENFEKSIDSYRTMNLALQKAGLKSEIANPMEAERYFVDENKISYYYSLLESFCNTYDIPSHFILNADEEGHEDYSDSLKERVVVTQETKGPVNYPVKRSNTRTTFLACITADGSYLKPLIVIKRKTIEARAFRVPIFDKLYIASNESGFITTEIFDEWVDKILIPYIDSKREELKYTGPAVLILDGCVCHYSPNLYRVCTMHFIKIFFLPPHSSNQTQPLDLVVFHLHKDKIRHYIKLESDDEKIGEKLQILYATFQSIATIKHIQGSFEAAGAIYEGSNTLNPIVHFNRNFATHILSSPKTKKEKKELAIKRKGLELQEHDSRINVSDIQAYWDNDESSKATIAKVMQKVPKIIDPSRDDEPQDLFHRLLQAFVPVDEVENSQFYPEQPRGRPKKQPTEQDETQPQKNPNYQDLDFDLRLELELKSLGFIVE